MTDNPFGGTGGGQLTTEEYTDKLMLIVPTEVKKDVTTSNGTADAVIVDAHVFVDGGVEKVDGAWLFQKALVGSLRSKVGAGLNGTYPIFGRLVRGPEDPKIKDPHSRKVRRAWKLVQEFSDEELAAAVKYWESQKVAAEEASPFDSL